MGSVKIEKQEKNERLKILHSLQRMSPFEKKILTDKRIDEWYEFYEGKVYISFSGGIDSTVLLDIARERHPDIEAVFSNTGLEYPEIQSFVKTFDNVSIIRPKMRFDEVIKKYGYPMISKEVAECVYQGRLSLARNDGKYSYRLKKLKGEALDKDGNPSLFNKAKYEPLLYTDFILGNNCCTITKKNPLKEFSRKSGKMPITAQMASESDLRTQQWCKNGCNGFDMKSPISNPMSFWYKQDALTYIKENNIRICSVYGDIVYEKNGYKYDNLLCDNGCRLCTTGCDRTGCIFCGFGLYQEQQKTGISRFERLKITHPRQYEYCMGGGEHNENGIWQPNKEGLGMAYVIDGLNKIYGKGYLRY